MYGRLFVKFFFLVISFVIRASNGRSGIHRTDLFRIRGRCKASMNAGNAIGKIGTKLL